MIRPMSVKLYPYIFKCIIVFVFRNIFGIFLNTRTKCIFQSKDIPLFIILVIIIAIIHYRIYIQQFEGKIKSFPFMDIARRAAVMRCRKIVKKIQYLPVFAKKDTHVQGQIINVFRYANVLNMKVSITVHCLIVCFLLYVF